MFGPGLLGTLGMIFQSLFPHEHFTISIQRKPAPKAEKDVEPCVFHCAYARNEHVLFFLLDESTHWRSSSDIL